MGRMRAVSQGLVFLLMADAGWVFWGLLHQRNMWAWIVVYWALLTVKNAVDFTSSVRLRLTPSCPGPTGRHSLKTSPRAGFPGAHGPKGKA